MTFFWINTNRETTKTQNWKWTYHKWPIFSSGHLEELPSTELGEVSDSTEEKASLHTVVRSEQLDLSHKVFISPTASLSVPTAIKDSVLHFRVWPMSVSPNPCWLLLLDRPQTYSFKAETGHPTPEATTRRRWMQPVGDPHSPKEWDHEGPACRFSEYWPLIEPFYGLCT